MRCRALWNVLCRAHGLLLGGVVGLGIGLDCFHSYVHRFDLPDVAFAGHGKAVATSCGETGFSGSFGAGAALRLHVEPREQRSSLVLAGLRLAGIAAFPCQVGKMLAYWMP